MNKIKILIIENETLVRAGVCAILGAEKDFEIVGDARTSAEGFSRFREKRPDVTLMSLRLPDLKCRLMRPRASRCRRDMGCSLRSCSSSLVVTGHLWKIVA
jgi:DNA-binding NarL/FixJ family response regulator